jgi:hypothetical protein
MQEKYGRAPFDIIPDTYVLPEEIAEFCEHFNKLATIDPFHNVWIIKPTNASRGRGISLVSQIVNLKG